MNNSNIINKLEDRLNYQWQLANSAKSSHELLRLRSEALKTYRELKKTKQILGVK